MLTLALTLSAKLFISFSSNSSAPPTLLLGRWLPSKAKTTSAFSSYLRHEHIQAYSCKIKDAKQTSNITRSESSDIAIEGDFTQRWLLWIKSTFEKGGSLGRQTQVSEQLRLRYVSIWGAKPRAPNSALASLQLNALPQRSLSKRQTASSLRQTTNDNDGRQPEVDILHHWANLYNRKEILQLFAPRHIKREKASLPVFFFSLTSS